MVLYSLTRSLRRSCLCNRVAASPHQALYPARIAPPRGWASISTADERIEEIQELYATAKDEFEIASEETEKMSVYAEEDRKAARAELEKLQAAFRDATEGPSAGATGDEIRQRVGSRIRELVRAVEAMEELAQNQD